MAGAALRLSISGSHGTGKTTLCHALVKRLSIGKFCNLQREAPRLIIDETDDPQFFARERNTLIRQLLIFIFQAVEEHDDDDCDFIIHDRTPVDVLAYTFLLDPDFESSPEGRLLTNAVRKWVRRFDFIFKTPIEFPLVPDGVREPDIHFQHFVDRKIDTLYRYFEVEPICVSGSVVERTRQVLSHFSHRFGGDGVIDFSHLV